VRSPCGRPATSIKGVFLCNARVLNTRPVRKDWSATFLTRTSCFAPAHIGGTGPEALVIPMQTCLRNRDCCATCREQVKKLSSAAITCNGCIERSDPPWESGEDHRGYGQRLKDMRQRAKGWSPSWHPQCGYLVDPASSHMLVSKIKPCMSKYKLLIW
jgi:hypothetical protein